MFDICWPFDRSKDDFIGWSKTKTNRICFSLRLIKASLSYKKRAWYQAIPTPELLKVVLMSGIHISGPKCPDFKLSQ